MIRVLYHYTSAPTQTTDDGNKGLLLCVMAIVLQGSMSG